MNRKLINRGHELVPAKDAGGSKLIVFLHGFRSRMRSDSNLIQLIQTVEPQADIYCPSLPYKNLFSLVRMTSITKHCLEAIDWIWNDRQKQELPDYTEVIFVGHSTGAVLARKLVACAYGEIQSIDSDGRKIVKSPFEDALDKQQRHWSTKITRLVLLASMTRGWSIESVKSRFEVIKWRIGAFLGHILFSRPTIFDIRRGAPFLVQTRLQWLELMRAPEGRKPDNLIVVQLLGTIDNLVSPDDNLDFAIDRGNQFHFIQVPYTSHTSMVEVTPQFDEDGAHESSISMNRSLLIKQALTSDSEQLRQIAEPIDLMVDLLPPTPDESIENIVFVIHGIRDLGFWTQKIATKIKKTSDGSFKSLTPSYGYFAMFPFVWWWVRRRKVEWLMDQYVDARASYPNARINYVGHSNGTYLLAKALTDYPSCRVANVVFAGSVVRSDFNWARFQDSRQVQKVLNYVATGDWVVASFPSAVQAIKKFDLGSAGVNGFNNEANDLSNLEYVKGSHSAALKESQWDDIANFIVNGTLPVDSDTDFDVAKVAWVDWIDKNSWWLLLVVLIVLLLGLWIFVLPLLSKMFAVLVLHPIRSIVLLVYVGIYIFIAKF